MQKQCIKCYFTEKRDNNLMLLHLYQDMCCCYLYIRTCVVVTSISGHVLLLPLYQDMCCCYLYMRTCVVVTSISGHVLLLPLYQDMCGKVVKVIKVSDLWSLIFIHASYEGVDKNFTISELPVLTWWGDIFCPYVYNVISLPLCHLYTMSLEVKESLL